MRRIGLLCAVVMVTLGPGAARAAAGTETAADGATSATVSYVADQYGLGARDVRVAITRDGVPALRGDDPGRACSLCRGAIPVGGQKGSEQSSLTVRDLDGDGDPEVILELYSGGAHCCTLTVLYRFDGTRYRRSSQYWGNFGVRIADVGHDGRVELSGYDERFVYRFCAFVCSAAPPRILRLAGGRLVDVTRAFGDRAARDGADLLRAIRRLGRSERFAEKGLLPAYCADAYLSGRGSRCRAELSRALRRGALAHHDGDLGLSGRAYVRDLLAFLKRTGYRRG